MSGKTVLGFGRGHGEGRAQKGVDQSTASVALEGIDLFQAKGILLNVRGSQDLTLKNLHLVVDALFAYVASDVDILTNCSIEKTLDQKIEVLWIATALPESSPAET